MELFHTLFKRLALCFVVTFVLFSSILVCSDPEFEDAVSPSSGVAFVLTGDRMGSASYSTIDYTSLVAYNDLGSGMVHTDAAARSYDGLVYVINRLGRDNIQVIDPEDNFGTIREISMGSASNPHDIMVVAADKAYVTRYDESELWIINPGTGEKTGVVDLSSYDPSDSIPEMDRMYYDSEHKRLFVSIQKLNRNDGWLPTDNSLVLVINTETDKVIREVVLKYNDSVNVTNPYTHFRFVSKTAWQPDPADGYDHLLISCVGTFHYFHPNDPADGAIVAIALADDIDAVDCVNSGPILTEDAFDEEITDFVITDDGQNGYAVTQDVNGYSRLFRFNPQTGSDITTMRYSDELMGPLWSLALHSSGKLFVCDRKATDPGVRVYDTTDNDRPLNDDKPVYVGFPPEELVFVE